jgi:biopolymer transport protein ExbD
MAFKPTAAKANKRKTEGELNMNSMMDMVTIILLFLLKTYSTEGALKAGADDLKLPESYRMLKPTKATNISVSKSVIMIGDRTILNVSDVEEDNNLIQQLATPLRAESESARKLEEYGGEFKNEVLLIIDKDTPFNLMFKVIYTCSKSDYFNIKLMVQSGQLTENF